MNLCYVYRAINTHPPQNGRAKQCTMYDLDYESFSLRGSIEDQMKTFYFLTRRCEPMHKQVNEHWSSDAERRV